MNLYKNKRIKITLTALFAVAMIVVGLWFWLSKNVPSAQADWWNDNWTYRKALVINHEQVAGDLTDFPVLVSLTDTSLSGHAQEDGDDFKFILHGSGEALSHEIESYASTTGALVAWVKIPSLSATDDTIIYMYYGNSSVASQEDGENVWDENYAAVFHLKEEGDTNRFDSTINANILAETSGDTVARADGKIGNAANFALGDTELLELADGGSLDISGADQPITISGWVQLATAQSASVVYAISKYDINSERQYALLRGGDNFGQINIGYSDGNSHMNAIGETTVTTTGLWYYFVGVYNDTDIRFYLNSTLDTSTYNPQTYSSGISNGSSNFAIGGRYDTGTPVGFWDGLIDEVRVSNIARSLAWIETEYNNQNNPATFFAEQDEETGPGPVGYWTFDDPSTGSGQGGGVIDHSGQGNHGTNYGAVQQDESMCVSGKCLYFDGTSDWIDLDSPPVLENMGPLSISLWIKANDDSAARLFTTDTTSSGGWVLYIKPTNSISFEVDSGGNMLRTTSNNVIQLNKWHHIIATWDGSMTAANAHVYIDGIEHSYQTTQDGSGTWTDAGYDKSIGGRAADSYFNGFIDEVKIYPYARTAEKIRQDYTAGLAGISSPHGVSASFGSASDKWLTDGLVGYWNMDEPSSASTFADSSGNGNTGTAYGNASTTGGKFGNAYTGDGISDYVQIADSPTLDISGQVTFSAWVYADSLSTFNRVIHMRDSYASDDGYWQFYVDYTDKILKFKLDDINEIQHSYIGTIVIPEGEWVHIVATYDGKTMRSYINGEKDAYELDAEFNINTGDQYMNIGSGNAGTDYEWDGQLDEIRIYNRALSPAEVKNLYQWAPGPVAHWKMDEHGGQTAYDSAASTTFSGGNNGTYTSGTPKWSRGKYGGAIELDENNDWIDLGSNNKLDIREKISIAYWIKGATGQTAWAPIMYRTGTYFWMIQVNSSGPNIHIRIDTSGGINQSDGQITNVLDNNWHHVAFVLDQGSEKTYKDGILQVDTTYNHGNGFSSASQNQYIGHNNEAFNGLIDDIRIYNYARTQKQILEDMAGASAGASASRGAAQKYPVLHLSFDEGYGATAYDSSIHKNHGTLYPGNSGSNTASSAMWSLDGKFGKAMEFDGTDDYVYEAPDIDLSPGNGSWTAVAWAKPENKDQAAALIYNDADNPPAYPKWGMGFLNSTRDGAGKKFWAVYQESYSGLIWRAAGSVDDQIDGNWHQYAMVADKSVDEVKLFVDSVEIEKTLVNSGVWPDIDTSSQSTRIGVDSGGLFFDGLMDEVKVWNYALSADEIRTEYNQSQAAVMGSLSTPTAATSSNAASRAYCVPGSTDYCAAPVGEWRFDEKVGTTTYDKSGQGNDGNFVTSASSPAWRGSGSCKTGNCLEFDGADDYIEVAENSALDVKVDAGYSFFLWTKKNGDCYSNGDTYRNEVLVNRSYGQGYWWFGCVGDIAGNAPHQNKITLEIRDADVSGNGGEYYSQITINDDNWHYVGWLWDPVAEEVRIYADGQLESTSSVSFANDFSNEGPLCIGDWGSCGDDNQYHGLIDEIKIYNYARTPAQVAWDYNKGKPVAHWRFDECSGGTIYDQSGNANHGTLNLGTSGVTATGICASSSDSFWYNGRSGKYNSAGSFDGTDDYVRVEENSALDINYLSGYSFFIWIKKNGNCYGNYADNRNEVFANRIGGPGYWWFGCVGDIVGNAPNQNKIILDIRDADTSGNGGDFFSQITINDNNWHYVGWVWDPAAQEVRIYADGELESANSESFANDISNEGPLCIGDWGSCGDQYQYDGLLDNIKIWNYALTAEQIRTEYNGGAVRFQ